MADAHVVATNPAAPTPGATLTAVACILTANSDTPIYDRPAAGSSQFGILSAGQQVTASGQTASGWLGFGPGVAQAANVGIFRLRWLAPGSKVRQSGDCGALPEFAAVSATTCYEMAMADTPVYAQPSTTASVIATLPAGEYAAVAGKNAQDWLKLDLSDGSLAGEHRGQTGWIAPEAANFNGQSCANLPTVTAASTSGATAAGYTDPFAYCAAVGTVDTPGRSYVGPKIPASVITGLRKAADLSPDAPEAWVVSGTVWRCMDGQVWACFIGANLPCSDKADTSQTPTKAMTDFCQANPDADAIPAAVTGRATVYEWKCTGGSPAIGKQIFQPDARGFISNFWYEIVPNAGNAGATATP
jgi:hypothetical protein